MKSERTCIWFVGIGLGLVVSGSILLVTGIELIKQESPILNPEVSVAGAVATNQVDELLIQNSQTEPEQKDIEQPQVEEPIVEEEPQVGQAEEVEEIVPLEVEDTTEVLETTPVEQPEEVPVVEEAVKETTEEPTTEEIPTQVEETASQSADTITVFIPDDSTASMISQLLYDTGVIDDVTAFRNFVIKQEKTTVLQKGNRVFPVDANYADILDVLLYKNE
ncbi:MAG: hypothetical protein ATN35_08500 [Epulopiscium sp. Nele67-Bin004]|nr:MAG: hypothetical protein ATN35_08500 [Epulopiscium sp. Nele67-Bin004]